MLRLSKSMRVLLLLILSACAQTNGVPNDFETSEAVQTAAMAVAQTQLASVTSNALPTVSFATIPGAASQLPTNVLPTYPIPSPSATSSVPPTVTPTAITLPADFSPVVLGKNYGGGNMFAMLMGGVQGARWLSPEEAAAMITGAAEYDVYTLAGARLDRVYGTAPGFSPPSRAYFLGTAATLNEPGMVGVAHGWQMRQVVAEELPAENELYRQAMIDWLAQAGIPNPQTGTMHIYRIDLEGDGNDEIFISDTLVESQHRAQPGDHSVILMRKVSGSGAVTIPVLAFVHTSVVSFPCSYSVANFIDLDQDGVLEVIVEFVWWEGYGGSVYQVRGETVERVLGNFCTNQ